MPADRSATSPAKMTLGLRPVVSVVPGQRRRDLPQLARVSAQGTRADLAIPPAHRRDPRRQLLGEIAERWIGERQPNEDLVANHENKWIDVDRRRPPKLLPIPELDRPVGRRVVDESRGAAHSRSRW